MSRAFAVNFRPLAANSFIAVCMRIQSRASPKAHSITNLTKSTNIRHPAPRGLQKCQNNTFRLPVRSLTDWSANDALLLNLSTYPRANLLTLLSLEYRSWRPYIFLRGERIPSVSREVDTGA